MVSSFSKVAIGGIALVAILYQLVVKNLVFDVLGYGRLLVPLNSFDGVTCEKVTELGLESCEDMWLHEATGFLYMACSDTKSRSLNDRIAVLDTRGSGRLASRIKWLTMENFSGINGDGTINLHGFDVWADENTNTLRFILINHRPPINPVTGKPILASTFGANSTMEVFQTKVGSDSLRHIRTYSDEVIATPNRVQWVNSDAFIWTNDHSGKIGARRHLDPLLGGGSVGHCDRTRCNIAKHFGTDFAFPNGLVRGHDGLFYVPSSITGEIRVYSLNGDHKLDQVGSVKVPYPVDNLSVDKNGNIFAAAFPQVYKWAAASKDPFNLNSPSAVFRISGGGRGRGTKEELRQKEYNVERVLEDDGTVFPGSTIAVHDAETGRYFLGSVISPYITICETT